jgi:hypothetical protein
MCGVALIARQALTCRLSDGALAPPALTDCILDANLAQDGAPKWCFQ